jgi:poly-gamma-glutamate capsule biosynthesis protein CapA/YwtB (metallophosphatase superfamily)
MKLTNLILLSLLTIIIIASMFYRKKNDCIVIGLAGGVVLGRSIEESSRRNGYEYPLLGIISTLKANTFNLINLESAITKSQKPIAKRSVIKSEPEGIQTLLSGNIGVVNLANNHVLDFAEYGMFETIKVLTDNGISAVGAGGNIFEARKMEIVEKNGIKIGIIGCTDSEPTWQASENLPGTNYVEIDNSEDIENHIRMAKKLVDVLIVSFHWGSYKLIHRLPEKAINFVRRLAYSGADIFHGHGTHAFHGIESIDGKLILYDTGDLISDSKINLQLRNDQSFIYNVKITKKGITNLELIPIVRSNLSATKASEEEGKMILEKIKFLSAEFATTVKIEKNAGYIKVI